MHVRILSQNKKFSYKSEENQKLLLNGHFSISEKKIKSLAELYAPDENPDLSKRFREEVVLLMILKAWIGFELTDKRWEYILSKE